MINTLQPSGFKRKNPYFSTNVEKKSRPMFIEEKLAKSNLTTEAFTCELNALSSQNLRELTIFHSKALSDRALLTLAESKLSLTSLSLEGCRKYGEKGVASLIKLITRIGPILERLNLNVPSRALNESSLTQIVNLAQQLKELHLSHASIDKETIAAISRLNNLLILDISSCKISDHDFEALPPESFLSLKYLEVWGNAIAKAFMTTMSRCQHLEKLIANCCTEITDEALIHLPPGSFPKLLYLNLTYAKITKKSISILSHWKNLETLILSRCESVIFCKPISDHFSNITSLEIADTSTTDESVADVISQLPKLKSLDISDCRQVTGQLFCSLPSHAFSTLTSLDASRTHATSASIIALSHLQLETLNVSNCKGVDDQANPLDFDFPNLSFLNVSGTSITDYFVQQLARNRKIKKLKYLDLSNNQISCLSVIALAESEHLNKTLIALELSGSKISIASFCYLPQLNLQRLGVGWLPNTPLDRQSLGILAQCSQLTHLNINRMVRREDVDFLVQKMPHLERLYTGAVMKKDYRWVVYGNGFDGLKDSHPQLTINTSSITQDLLMNNIT